MSRSIADQSTHELGGPLSVLSRQKRDHVALDRMLRFDIDPGSVSWLRAHGQGSFHVITLNGPL